MKRMLALVWLFVVAYTSANGQLTLDYCFERAEVNYPLIQKYDILNRTSAIELSNINKGWLPRATVYGQVTGQNIVPGFPSALGNMLEQMGQELRGLGKVQYKIGVDVSQTIWDGGMSKAQRSIERASTAEREAAINVELYKVRERVLNLFFSILLMEEQIALSENTYSLLQANHQTVCSMVKNGVAMRSDADMIEAQMLTVGQQLPEARTSLSGFRTLLGIYLGEELGDQTLVPPTACMPYTIDGIRPELEHFAAQLELNQARQQSIEASTMPRASLFGQAYYGYPGFNYFESMMNRKLSFNILAGVKLSWNIDALYTKKNARHRLATQAEDIEVSREVFLFNNKLSTTAQQTEIEGLRKSMKDDSRIVELRTNVRKAAESQLKNGIIDATALLAKITDENQAQLTESLHRTQLLNKIYTLKYLLNQ